MALGGNNKNIKLIYLKYLYWSREKMVNYLIEKSLKEKILLRNVLNFYKSYYDGLLNNNTSYNDDVDVLVSCSELRNFTFNGFVEKIFDKKNSSHLCKKESWVFGVSC